MENWPEDILQFAWIQDLDHKLNDLANKAEHEDWSYQNTPSEHEKPILYNYIRYTYRRVAEERKVTVSEDGQFACFNTGLVTSSQEPLFASFEVNRYPEARQRWYFKEWFYHGERQLNVFPELPDLASYFDDPTCLVFDARKDFRLNTEHIIQQTPRDRFPEPYRNMTDYALQTVVKGAISNARERARRSYKAAVPQYYGGAIQLLLPLCLSDPQRADLGLAVEIHSNFYRGATCLTLDMAYNNARQLAKPDRDWLQP